MGNEQSASHHHGSSPYASATTSRTQKPTKSAIRSSRSVRQEPDELPSCQESTSTTLSSSSSSRYIPNMKGNGLILPTKPYGKSQSADNQVAGNTNGSEMSPQWGWYINTTPPTPELYHSRLSSTSGKSSEFNTATLSRLPPSNTPVDGKRCQNQVFQNLKNSNTPIHGWTSIPI